MALRNFLPRIFQRPKPAVGNAPDLSERSISQFAVAVSGLFSIWQTTAYNPEDDLSQAQGFRTYEKMRHDDQIKAALNLKKGSMLSTGWEVESASDKPVDKDARDQVEYALTHMDPLYGSFDDHMYQILSAFDFGFSATEVIYQLYEAGPWAGFVGLKTLKTRKAAYFNFKTDDKGNLDPMGLVQHGKIGLPVEKFLIYPYQQEYGNFYGMSDLRAAYNWWWLKNNLIRWSGILLERFAIPISVGKYPLGHKKSSDIDALRTILENLQANTSLTMPDVFSLDFHEVGASGTDIFIKMIEQANMGMTRSLLVPSLLGVSTQPDTGSFSQAKKHFDVFLIVITDARRDLAEDIVTNQLVRRLVDFNFVVDDYPQFKFKEFTGDDMTQLFEAYYRGVTEGIVKPTHEDEIHIRSRTRFPERDIPDDELPPDLDNEPPDDLPPEDDPDNPPAQFQNIRAPVKAERKVNFQRIERTLDGLQEDTREAVVEVIERTKVAVLSLVDKKQRAGDLNPTFVKSLDLKYKGDLNRVFREFLGQGYRQGIREAREMLPRRRMARARVGPGIAPEKALAFFESKGLEIAGVLKQRLKDDIARILFQAMKTGELPDETQRKIAEAFEPYVGDPTALDSVGVGQVQPFRIETILRTNATEAFNEGIKDSVTEEIDDGFVIGFLYSAIRDSRITRVCNFLGGAKPKIFRPNSVALNQLTPPNHHQCRSLLIPLTRDEGPVRFVTQAQIGRGLELKAKGF